MSELFVLVLEAHHRERNHHRRYALRVGVDLLGDYLLMIEFGRVGQAGTELRFGGSHEAVRDRLHAHLRRRASAPRRIQCSYEQVAFKGDLAIAADWLEGSTITLR